MLKHTRKHLQEHNIIEFETRFNMYTIHVLWTNYDNHSKLPALGEKPAFNNTLDDDINEISSLLE